MYIFNGVQDMIGPWQQWPNYILRYLFCELLTPNSRVILGAFCYGNGLNIKRTALLLEDFTSWTYQHVP